MPIKLRKKYFARNRSREKQVGDFFSQTSISITKILPFVINVFFAPALITTSLFSKDLLIAVANISLSLGYLTNFFYRLYNKEVSISELLVTVLTIAAFLTAAILLSQPIVALTFTTAMVLINEIAIAINLFFLIKHTIVPPLKRLLEDIAQKLGFDISGRYFSKPPLTLKDNKDRPVIDLLLEKHYGHKSSSAEFKEQEIVPFNKLLFKLTQYINKYDETFFGYIKNKDSITKLEDYISQLSIQGNSDGSYAFIKRKISLKETKVTILKEACAEVTRNIEMPQAGTPSSLKYFKNFSFHKAKPSREEQLKEGLDCLNNEIKRQENKIASLRECLPKPF